MSNVGKRESELMSTLCLDIIDPTVHARSLRRRFSVTTVMAQFSAACSITLLTHVEYTRYLIRSGRLWLVRRGSSWQNKNIYSAWPQPARNHLHQRVCHLNSRTLGQPQTFGHHPSPPSLFFYPSLGRAVPKHRAHLKSGSVRKGPLMSLHFLCILHHKQPSHIATYSCLTDATRILSRFPQQFQINARHHNLCLRHVHLQTLLLHLGFSCLKLYKQFFQGLSTDHHSHVCTDCAELPR